MRQRPALAQGWRPASSSEHDSASFNALGGTRVAIRAPRGGQISADDFGGGMKVVESKATDPSAPAPAEEKPTSSPTGNMSPANQCLRSRLAALSRLRIDQIKLMAAALTMTSMNCTAISRRRPPCDSKPCRPESRQARRRAASSPGRANSPAAHRRNRHEQDLDRRAGSAGFGEGPANQFRAVLLEAQMPSPSIPSNGCRAI